MSLGDLLKTSGLVPESRISAVLKNFEDSTYKWIVRDPDNDQPRLQGDILNDIPAAAITPDGESRRRVGPAMLINTVCDLQPERSEVLNVAPVMDFAKFADQMISKNPQRADNFLRSVKRNEKDEFIYIPACAQFQNGAVVQLGWISPISPSIYEQALSEQRRRATLTQYGYYFFLMKLTRYLARPEPSEVSRDMLGS